MQKFNFGDVPDNFITKKQLIFNRSLWRCLTEFGWEQVIQGFEVGAKAFTYDTFKYRLDDAIQTARKIISGEIKEPEKMISYTLFPPGGFIRADLQQGSMKLLYGESVDVSYIAIWDLEQTLYTILNAHLEDGIPVDWWMLGPEDEILERRHMKTGIKLRDIPNKIKGDFHKFGQHIIDILKDLRNERTPQFASSTYMIGITWASHAAHLPFIFSYYEALGRTWDLLTAKKNGTGVEGFSYIPTPATIQLLTFMSRPDYIVRSAGLLSDHKMYIIGLEEENRNFLQANLPEVYDLLVVEKWKNGLPWPYQTVNVEAPYEKMKKKGAWERAKKQNMFKWKYDNPEHFIKMENLEMDFDEIMNGVFLDLNHFIEPNGVNLRDIIISKGCGLYTEFY